MEMEIRRMCYGEYHGRVLKCSMRSKKVHGKRERIREGLLLCRKLPIGAPILIDAVPAAIFPSICLCYAPKPWFGEITRISKRRAVKKSDRLVGYEESPMHASASWWHLPGLSCSLKSTGADIAPCSHTQLIIPLSALLPINQSNVGLRNERSMCTKLK
jgi:hypothetical protein